MTSRNHASGSLSTVIRALAGAAECLALAVFGSLLLLASLALTREPIVRL